MYRYTPEEFRRLTPEQQSDATIAELHAEAMALKRQLRAICQVADDWSITEEKALADISAMCRNALQ